MKKKYTAQNEYPRLDHFLTEKLPDMSRTHLVKLIQDGYVLLNNKTITKKNSHINSGDVIELEFPEKPIEESIYQPSFQLNKLFEDEYLMIIDKPSGISVHPGAGEKGETIFDIFRFYYPQIDEIRDTERAGIVHRLDKDTSGILILAKDFRTMRQLQKQFKRREIKKTYLAFVSGNVRYRNGTIDAPIGRSPRNRTRFRVVLNNYRSNELAKAREAVTEFSVIRQFNDFAYIKVFPQTGRTHQIRVHFSHFGNPVLGDSVYGKANSFKRLALHAYSIEFYHPQTGNLITSFSPFPEQFRQFLLQQYKS